jgi:hypothetical protein
MSDHLEIPNAATIRAETERLTLAAFKVAYKQPAIHLTLNVSGRVKSAGETKSQKEKSFERTSTRPPTRATADRYQDRIAFIAKRDGNPFPNMISVGRALNNDIIVTLSTVSKLHGYFMSERDHWSFIDHGSKNGTKINDHPLQKNEKRRLADGDRIRLGLELLAVFYSPEALYGFLRRSSSAASP